MLLVAVDHISEELSRTNLQLDLARTTGAYGDSGVAA